MTKFDSLQDHEFRRDEWAAQEREPETVRAGERVQAFWCQDCQEWHTGSVLGGPIGDPHGEAKR